MPPSLRDKALATGLADRIVRVTHDRVRGVFMIGSRALGRATLASDLDLVVLVETDAAERPWGGRDAAAEADRIQREVGVPPIRTDLTVRSVDQFEEAKNVIGGVEWLVIHEGVQLFSSPLRRRPTPRLSPAVVRRALVYAWLEAATRSLTDGWRADNLTRPDDRVNRAAPNASSDAGRGVAVIIPTAAGVQQVNLTPPFVGTDAQYHRKRAAQKAVTALCVAHQIDTSKRDGFDTMFARLEKAEPEFATTWGRTLINGDFGSRAIGGLVTAVLHTALVREGPHPCVAELRRRLRAMNVPAR